MTSFSWKQVAVTLRELAERHHRSVRIDDGQRSTLRFIADRIERHGVVVADEVGQGKTRIACAVVQAVVMCGGRAAVVVPRGLMHQWRREYGELGAKKKPIVLSTLHSWVHENHHPAEGVGAGWWLISHGFEYPRVTSHADEWKCALPSLVNAMLHPREQKDGRTVHGQVFNRAKATAVPWPQLRAMADRIVRRLPKGHELRQDLERLPTLSPGSDAPWLRTDFLKERSKETRNSRWVAEQLVGVWMGNFDLVVVDEAHKSRDPSEDDDGQGAGPTTVLGNLLGLLRAKDQRRLCLTATPMELHPEQWGDLVRRANPGAKVGAIEAAARSLTERLAALQNAPDDTSRAEDAIAASRAFEASLEGLVTRRRLLSAAALGELREEIGHFDPAARSVPHPHRRFEDQTVRLESGRQQDRHSRQMLVALEGFSRACMGPGNGQLGEGAQKAKTLYTRIASGKVSADCIEAGWLEEGPADEDVPGAAASVDRLRFWASEFDRARAGLRQEAKRRNVGQLLPEVAHPRIEATVEAIERWTEGRPAEKVLVFGTFTDPMRNLRDVVDVRHCLREVDAGRPIPVALDRSKRLWPVALWQYERMRVSPGAFTGRLRGRLTRAQLTAAVRTSHRQHQALLKAVAQASTEAVRPFSQTHRGAGYKLEDRLRAALRTRVLDAIGTLGRPAQEGAPGHRQRAASGTRGPGKGRRRTEGGEGGSWRAVARTAR